MGWSGLQKPSRSSTMVMSTAISDGALSSAGSVCGPHRGARPPQRSKRLSAVDRPAYEPPATRTRNGGVVLTMTSVLAMEPILLVLGWWLHSGTDRLGWRRRRRDAGVRRAKLRVRLLRKGRVGLLSLIRGMAHMRLPRTRIGACFVPEAFVGASTPSLHFPPASAYGGTIDFGLITQFLHWYQGRGRFSGLHQDGTANREPMCHELCGLVCPTVSTEICRAILSDHLFLGSGRVSASTGICIPRPSSPLPTGVDGRGVVLLFS